MGATPDLVKDSAGIPATLKVTSADPAYIFADVTGARVKIRKGSIGGGREVERVADSFAVILGILHVVVTLLAEDLNEPGTLYLTAIAERPSGDLPALEQPLHIGI